MTISKVFAKEHITKWIQAWNNHDLKTVLSMYSENIQFSSPKIKVVFPERDTSTINNLKELEEYWSAALKNNFPKLRFTAKDVIVNNNNTVILEYFATLDGKYNTSVIEKFEFGDNGLIIESSVFYGVQELIEKQIK